MAKMREDLVSGNVQMKQATVNAQGEAMLTAAGIGLNTNGIITSCINFLDANSTQTLAKNFGNAVGVAGLVAGASQTVIAFSDGNISNADLVAAVGTALSTAGVICAFIPGAAPIAGVLGVTGAVIGIVSSFMSDRGSMSIEVILENNKKVYVYIPGAATA